MKKEKLRGIRERVFYYLEGIGLCLLGIVAWLVIGWVIYHGFMFFGMTQEVAWKWMWGLIIAPHILAGLLYFPDEGMGTAQIGAGIINVFAMLIIFPTAIILMSISGMVVPEKKRSSR